jgi:hypothetical protein
MDARYPSLLGCAVGAFVLATPAVAQPEIPYEYTHPAPPQPEVVFRHDPVVQPIPGTDPDLYAQPVEAPRYEHEDRREVYDPPVEPDVPMQPPFERHDGPPPPPHAQGPDDYAAWLEDCFDRYGEHDGRRERADRDARAHCEAMFAHHHRRRAMPYPGAYPGPLPHPAPYPAPYAYGYAAPYGYPLMWVPVLVQVPQRAVVHEYVTEEWVDEAPAPAKRRIIHRAAPRPGKYTKYVKER